MPVGFGVRSKSTRLMPSTSLVILAVILWIITIILFFKSNNSYSTADYEAQLKIMNAMRWQPACCIGAILSTAAAYVVSEIREYIDK